MIKLSMPKPDSSVPTTREIKVTDEAGEELSGICSVDLSIRPDELVLAYLTVMPEIEEIWATPFMSEESFLLAAEHYGYDVTKKET